MLSHAKAGEFVSAGPSRPTGVDELARRGAGLARGASYGPRPERRVTGGGRRVLTHVKAGEFVPAGPSRPTGVDELARRRRTRLHRCRHRHHVAAVQTGGDAVPSRAVLSSPVGPARSGAEG
ncbi:hypothetical protein ASG28_14030 [Frigoribacterium sp. Leaf415]|nr:hypothetical protein ASF07_15745 [Frigoribacterium sp. Leaf254]KQT40501.1 hypothetical protein ASG28_14030 [Frigoribacterium sp. Leaf415]